MTMSDKTRAAARAELEKRRVRKNGKNNYLSYDQIAAKVKNISATELKRMDAGRTEAETEAVKKVNAIPKKRDSANEEIADYSETLVASSWGTAVTIRGGTSDCGVLEEVEDGYYKPKTEQAKNNLDIGEQVVCYRHRR